MKKGELLPFADSKRCICCGTGKHLVPGKIDFGGGAFLYVPICWRCLQKVKK